MTMRQFLIAVALLAILITPAARAETSKQAFARGEAALADGDLDAALKAYATAARADRKNRAYYQRYSLVRQIVSLRKSLPATKGSQAWQQKARALHTFYVGEDLFDEALKLDLQLHERTNTAYSAALLAETQLTLDKAADAEAMLGELATEKATAATESLRGIAMARQEKLDEARQLAADIEIPAKADPGTLYNVARLKAAVGEAPAATQLLTQCFEKVAPSQLAGLKSHVKRSPEFAGMSDAAAFATAMKTKSKVSESSCSGGSSCSTCPMSGKCPSSK